MKLQWLGTAGFRIWAETADCLVDPYLSRNDKASPRQPLTPADFPGVTHIFVSHGHFDHIMDVPAIARATGARVVCAPGAARLLVQMGMDSGQIIKADQDGWSLWFGGIRARAGYSRHIRFDPRLVVSTLAGAGTRLPGLFPLFRNFSCGQVLSWRFEAEGRVIQFFGSAGAGTRELAALRPVHILMVPLQGHSRICDIGLEFVRHLSPQWVIPHHWDDFYPPVSRTVDITPFVRGVAGACPQTRVRVPDINIPISF